MSGRGTVTIPGTDKLGIHAEDGHHDARSPGCNRRRMPNLWNPPEPTVEEINENFRSLLDVILEDEGETP
jgi:hypothetical protein